MRFEMPENQYCKTMKEAHNLVSAIALFKLVPGQQIQVHFYHRLFKTLWQSWLQSVADKREKDMREAAAPRDLFLSNVMNSIISLGKKKDMDLVSGSIVPQMQRSTISSTKIGIDSISLKEKFSQRTKSKIYQNMLKQRQLLPMTKLKNNIIDTLQKHDVIVVCGETGSGKSTQVPQYILESEFFFFEIFFHNTLLSGVGETCRIACTQPRRISASSIATRVGVEMGDLGRYSFNLLYVFIMNFKFIFFSYEILYLTNFEFNCFYNICTTGILLRQLHSNRLLDQYSHIIIDEVHERSLQSDFLLVVLRQILEERNGGNYVILMSATIDANKFSKYFGEFNNFFFFKYVFGIHTFPVDVFHLEDIIEVTKYTCEQDAPNSCTFYFFSNSIFFF
eukprot:GSMAST32.ASY1.ANO1.249.1 assembled CDS